MPTYLSEPVYTKLLADLAGAFMDAATNLHTDLNERLAVALAEADVLPE